MFIKKGISGKDMSKNYYTTQEKDIPRIPEAQVSYKYFACMNLLPSF
jgi:hypothetical protein